MTADDPRSAPKLEQIILIILELCAADRPAGIPRLILVAQGVKEWVEAALYCLICLSEPAPLDGFPWFTV
ncbi:hypothetical protein B0H14DRAFT_3464924 [Mycena olivaceomarginata]|nr:hypothetical protein B0H14DRAFT_3464924 [Mycena olivaceomarginata]